jgi:diacylglycerol kinase (ATP)
MWHSPAMTRRWAAIVNPTSGRGLAPAALRSLTARLRRLADPVCVTSGASHAVELAKQCGHADGVIVAGGDGTLFEVLQGVARERQTLAVLPTGRGNSLARDLAVNSVRAGLLAVTDGADVRLDLLDLSIEFHDGRRWTGWSASNVAIGYVPAVVRCAGRRFRWAGRHCYALAGAVTRPVPTPVRIACGTEASRSVSASAIVVTNTCHLGPYEVCPEASCTDGRLDVLETQVGWHRQMVHNLSILSRLHVYRPVTTHRARVVRIESDTPLDVKIDGEVWSGVVGVTVGVSPGVLTCRVCREHRG